MKSGISCRLFSLLLLAGCIFYCRAKTESIKDIEPSGTLPILYINTEDCKEIDQKETYIDAEWWLDAQGIEGYENVGSEDKPQLMGIRGRGNTSWRHDGQKPYKIKLDKKTGLLGMKKNKHWALLARLNSYELYNEVLAFEIGRQLGMPWVPSVRPVEVVLNGIYIGLYMLTESVRIDDNRLEIFEQPELNEDPETIGDGWLVELDNNDDEFQVKIPQPQGYDLRITHKTPEVTNEMQDTWLIDQMVNITEAINNENKLDRTWEEFVDIDALVKHLIVQECLTNYDAYQGSCYIYKDRDSKWCFGPLWDFSWSGCSKKTCLIAERSEQHWIGEFFKFPRFKKRLFDLWNEYMEEYGKEWIVPFLTEFKTQIATAVEKSVQVWPDTPLDADEGLQTVIENVDYSMDFNDKVINRYCRTYQLSYVFTMGDDTFYPEEADPEIILPTVKFNGLEYENVLVTQGSSAEMTISTAENPYICYAMVDEQTFSPDENGEIIVPLYTVLEDKEVVISLGDKLTGIEKIETSPTFASYYDLEGRKVAIDKAMPGIYIEVKGTSRRKFIIK